jgi:hypothetical protein
MLRVVVLLALMLIVMMLNVSLPVAAAAGDTRKPAAKPVAGRPFTAAQSRSVSVSKTSVYGIFRVVRRACGYYVVGKIVEALVTSCLKKLKLFNSTNDTQPQTQSHLPDWKEKVEAEQEELWRITHQVYSELSAKLARMSNVTDSVSELQLMQSRLEQIENSVADLKDWCGKTLRIGESQKVPTNDAVTQQMLDDKLSEVTREVQKKIDVFPALVRAHDEEVIKKVGKYMSEIKLLVESRKQFTVGTTPAQLKKETEERKSSTSTTGAPKREASDKDKKSKKYNKSSSKN